MVITSTPNQILSGTAQACGEKRNSGLSPSSKLSYEKNLLTISDSWIPGENSLSGIKTLDVIYPTLIQPASITTSVVNKHDSAPAELSLKCTEAAAGAVSNSTHAGIALQSLPAPGSEKKAHSVNTTIREERERQWCAKEKEIEVLTDGLGMGLDKGVKDTVVALQLNGFNTSQSCEGHIGRGCGSPWVDIEAPGAPGCLFGAKGNSLYIMHRWKGQEESYRRVAEKHGIRVEELLDRKNHRKNEELLREAESDLYKNGETEEFIEWRLKNMEIRKAMDSILDTYNQTRNVPEDKKIQYYRFGENDTFRIHIGAEKDLFCNWNTMNESDKRALRVRLAGYRKSMHEFTQYLKECFMTQGPAIKAE